MTRQTKPYAPHAQQGAALIAAMLTVTLVATLAAGALWRHWQQVETETAFRGKQQAAWVLVGALDWSRLVLREDARDNSVDHLAEPWALPLKEARLGSFLSADSSSPDDAHFLDAYLSGQITDAQSKLNFANLLNARQVSAPDLADFSRLFVLLDLPEPELLRAVENYRFATDISQDNQSGALAAIAPTRWAQLKSLGLSAGTLEHMRPYVTLLPQRTKLNLNTAAPEVLRASIGGLDSADALRMVALRAQSHFKTLSEVGDQLPALAAHIQDARHTVSSTYFEVKGQLRVGKTIVQENSLVLREGTDVRVQWRDSSASLQSDKHFITP